MTQPTQAQIEAAIGAYGVKLSQVYANGRQPKPDDLRVCMKAAITAAHEAYLAETFSERWQAAKDKAAAAEVDGIGYVSKLVRDVDVMRSYETGKRDGTAATIERCAQALEGRFDNVEKYVAVIRALKDEK